MSEEKKYIEKKNLKENMANDEIKTETIVKNKIKSTIKKASEDAYKMAQSGYEIYQRNPDDQMYEINNIKTFIEGPNGELYIIFAYGNNNHTSEMDVIQI